jgi:hypothetical protein
MVAAVQPSGRAKFLKYKGPGSYTADGTSGDNGGNDLGAASVANNGSLILEGSVSEGKTAGTFTTPDVLLGLNPALKTNWKIVSPTGYSTILDEGTQLIYRQTGQSTFNVYNLSGILLPQQLHFPDSVCLGPIGSWSGSSLQGPVIQPGYFYARISNNSALAKYALPAFAKNSARPGRTEDAQHAKTFALNQNYPNPFNPTTTIRYDLPEAAVVKLSVFNTLGQEVRTLVNTAEPAGERSVQFNASDLPSGVYIYRITAGSFTDVKKMILLK